MPIGTVKWFDCKKGFGFLAAPDGQDVFVHYTSIEGDGFRRLHDGEQVEYKTIQGNKGLSAAHVKRIPTSKVSLDGVDRGGHMPLHADGRIGGLPLRALNPRKSTEEGGKETLQASRLDGHSLDAKPALEADALPKDGSVHSA